MPFGGKLDIHNRWFCYEALILWDELEEQYSQFFSESGRPAHDARLIIGAYCIQTMFNLSDEATELMIRENPYMQYFCGFDQLATDRLFDPNILGNLNKRFGDKFQNFDQKIHLILKRHNMLGQSQQRYNFLQQIKRWFKRLLF